MTATDDDYLASFEFAQIVVIAAVGQQFRRQFRQLSRDVFGVRQPGRNNHLGGSHLFARGQPQLKPVGLSIQRGDRYIFNHGNEPLLKRYCVSGKCFERHRLVPVGQRSLLTELL
ncbi:hypothetical protein CQ14_24580 [Bradyrhizobium lablabi]|uniref:Uncharacterized protein n=1 Tax=Bradyrhizobium lablabi TaxID=722472 RepID=A0A0R3MEY2_9BRAD|nr:hypothetical protein CQ14_24580 [Bradyrhizobium lablabi]